MIPHSGKNIRKVIDSQVDQETCHGDPKVGKQRALTIEFIHAMLLEHEPPSKDCFSKYYSKLLPSMFLTCFVFKRKEWQLIIQQDVVFSVTTKSWKLLYRNGVQQRRNSWQDGVFGTNCPIPPGQNFTYVLQVKDQIGSYYYFPSLAFHKAAGGYGGIKISSRPRIPVPFDPPAGDFTILAGDWFKQNHTVSSFAWRILLIGW